MSERMIDRFTQRVSTARGPEADADNGLAIDLGCFGWLRGIRDRALMLELRRKDGHVMAIGYGWIERVEFEPDKGITLHLPGKPVRITGSGLNHEVRPTVRLLDGIIRHRVPWICETDRGGIIATDESGIAVERIEWEA